MNIWSKLIRAEITNEVRFLDALRPTYSCARVANHGLLMFTGFLASEFLSWCTPTLPDAEGLPKEGERKGEFL